MQEPMGRAIFGQSAKVFLGILMIEPKVQKVDLGLFSYFLERCEDHKFMDL
jgi:hypothetical protein